jgi:hypothetical protein
MRYFAIIGCSMAIMVVAWSATVSAQTRIGRMADDAWNLRRSVRSQLFEEIDQLPEAQVGEDPEAPVERFKRGFFQRAAVAGGWLVSGDDADDLNITSWDASVSFALPLGSLDNLLVVTPQIRTDLLDGPTLVDVPGQLYETGVNFLWRKDLNDRWSVLAIVAPMVRSDFENTDNALRVFGLGVASWEWIPDELKLQFGVVYLDRHDIPLLPALGLQWTPTPVWQLDLTFPRPRLAYRLGKDGANHETWAYLGGALGGNTWSVRRADGSDDQLSLRDYRLVVGVERIVAGGGGLFVESGFVFGRRLEYDSMPDELDLDEGLVLRGGLSY